MLTNFNQRWDAATIMIQRCGILQDIALDCYDLLTYTKYHKIALRLIEYKINIAKNY